ncbi:dCTP deaminase domain-containing protein [Providencia stuartii]|uniref:dCTP deaminase domain-containing protein n=1 Tax=Providencia stuartii TaxID=588 RepID=UPI003D7F569E
MQLDSKEVIRLGYVRDCKGELLDPADYNKTSSVDITIGEILYKNDDNNIIPSVGATLKPQESLVIISDEIIYVPPNHVAYVFLKNRFSQKGFLALNTGIIDAGYFGPISTVIINFSNVDAAVPSGKSKEEKEFFRIVFHRITSDLTMSCQPDSLVYDPKEYDKYKDYRLKDLKNLPKTFLEPKVLKEQIQSELYSKISEFSIVRLGVTIAILGLFFTLLPMVRDTYFGWKYDIKDNIIIQKSNEVKINDLENDVTKLKEQIHELELLSNKRDKRG